MDGGNSGNSGNSSNSRKKWLIIVRRGVDGSLVLKEALDLAMIATAFAQEVSLLFLDDGVYHWCKNQQPQVLGLKPIFKSLGALPLYDVTRVFLCKRSALQRLVGIDERLTELKYLDADEIMVLMEDSDVVIDF